MVRIQVPLTVAGVCPECEAPFTYIVTDSTRALACSAALNGKPHGYLVTDELRRKWAAAAEAAKAWYEARQEQAFVGVA
jgi:hypothetical protein